MRAVQANERAVVASVEGQPALERRAAADALAAIARAERETAEWDGALTAAEIETTAAQRAYLAGAVAAFRLAAKERE